MTADDEEEEARPAKQFDFSFCRQLATCDLQEDKLMQLSCTRLAAAWPYCFHLQQFHLIDIQSVLNKLKPTELN